MAGVRIIQREDQQTWDSFVRSQDFAGPYHLFGWRLAVEKAYYHKAYYLLYEKEDKPCGVLPLIHLKPPFFKGALVSLPFCDYGGPLASHPEANEELIRNAIDLSASLGAKLEIRLREPNHILADSHHLTNESYNKVRMVLDLPGSSEELWSNFKAKLRSQIKKPQKDGLVFTIGSTELIDDFYTVFRINMKDLGSPVHSKTWIRSVVDALGKAAHVGVVYSTGIPVAAGIILDFKDTVTIPWASSLRQYNKSSPNMLLYWGFLKYACENGFRRFDFGRSTPDEGTYKFKEQWGAIPHALYWFEGNISNKNKRNAKDGRIRKMAEQMWTRLPQGFADIIGPLVRQYVSL